jgi:hypothetical protein
VWRAGRNCDRRALVRAVDVAYEPAVDAGVARRGVCAAALPVRERSWYADGVQGDQLAEGRFYAYRVNHRARGSELLKVKLIAKVGRGGKVKIRYEDGPHPGLEEYVRTMNLIVPWSERKALQRDEERHRLLDEYTGRSRRDSAVAVPGSSGLPTSRTRGRCGGSGEPVVGSDARDDRDD